jgi:hypothetical protein
MLTRFFFALCILQIMGAQHLPKRGGTDDIPSPFCSVIVYGDAADSAKHKTRAVPENGFNPVRVMNSDVFDFV